jgi:ferrochelatase
MGTDKPVGVVLLQLGGPDSLEAVEPFLYNLFCDPDIIDLPLAFLFRRALARIIARRRAPRVKQYYARIGGRSPILNLTRRQAAALEGALRPALDARVVIAMRYWHPMTDEAIDALVAAGVERVVLLPLYPHYSKTTTGSSLREWERALRRRGLRHFPVRTVTEYCEHPLYVAALVRNIGIALRRVPSADRGAVHLVFSAHGTPVNLVRGGTRTSRRSSGHLRPWSGREISAFPITSATRAKWDRSAGWSPPWMRRSNGSRTSGCRT